MDIQYIQTGHYILVYLTSYTDTETGETYPAGYQLFENPNVIDGEIATNE